MNSIVTPNNRQSQSDRLIEELDTTCCSLRSPDGGQRMKAKRKREQEVAAGWIITAAKSLKCSPAADATRPGGTTSAPDWRTSHSRLQSSAPHTCTQTDTCYKIVQSLYQCSERLVFTIRFSPCSNIRSVKKKSNKIKPTRVWPWLCQQWGRISYKIKAWPFFSFQSIKNASDRQHFSDHTDFLCRRLRLISGCINTD